MDTSISGQWGEEQLRASRDHCTPPTDHHVVNKQDSFRKRRTLDVGQGHGHGLPFHFNCTIYSHRAQ